MRLIRPIYARVTNMNEAEIKKEFGTIYGLKHKGGETLAIIGTIETGELGGHQ